MDLSASRKDLINGRNAVPYRMVPNITLSMQPMHTIFLLLPGSSSLKLHDTFRPFLVKNPGSAVSALDYITAFEQHLTSTGPAYVGNS